jgi:hypothetical protein
VTTEPKNTRPDAERPDTDPRNSDKSASRTAATDAEALSEPMSTYFVQVRGFDFDGVYVRARNHKRARWLCATEQADAGFGDIADGLRSITGCRLAPEAGTFPLLDETKSEGLVREPVSQKDGR